MDLTSRPALTKTLLEKQVMERTISRASSGRPHWTLQGRVGDSDGYGDSDAGAEVEEMHGRGGEHHVSKGDDGSRSARRGPRQTSGKSPRTSTRTQPKGSVPKRSSTRDLAAPATSQRSRDWVPRPPHPSTPPSSNALPNPRRRTPRGPPPRCPPTPAGLSPTGALRLPSGITKAVRLSSLPDGYFRIFTELKMVETVDATGPRDGHRLARLLPHRYTKRVPLYGTAPKNAIMANHKASLPNRLTKLISDASSPMPVFPPSAPRTPPAPSRRDAARPWHQKPTRGPSLAPIKAPTAALPSDDPSPPVATAQSTNPPPHSRQVTQATAPPPVKNPPTPAELAEFSALTGWDTEAAGSVNDPGSGAAETSAPAASTASYSLSRAGATTTAQETAPPPLPPPPPAAARPTVVDRGLVSLTLPARESTNVSQAPVTAAGARVPAYSVPPTADSRNASLPPRAPAPASAPYPLPPATDVPKTAQGSKYLGGTNHARGSVEAV
ncbi:hypothetical protein BDK51DRAFT_26186, partial [Blyttiomyces helicus]